MQDVTWSPLIAPSLIWIATILIGGLALFSAWRTRATWPIWSNLCALGMRTIAVACGLILVFRPVGFRQETQTQRASLLLLLDSSQSMALRGGTQKRPTPTRAEQGRPALRQLIQEAHKRKWTLHTFNAGKAVEVHSSASHSIQPKAPASPLGDWLHSALQQVSNSPSAPPNAVVFFTDGCINAGRPLKTAAQTLAARGTPLFPVLLGSKASDTPDAVLSNFTVRRAKVSSKDEATTFHPGEHLVIEARAWLKAPGQYRSILRGPLSTAPIHLMVREPGTEESQTLNKIQAYQLHNTLRHRLQHAPSATRVRMNFRPRHPGLYRLRLSIEAIEGEQNLLNNITFGTIHVEPPKRHTLYISSQLGHDYRRLKTMFSTWSGPRVEMVSDFIKPISVSNEVSEWPAEHVLARMLSSSTQRDARPGNIIWEEPDFTHISNRTQMLLRASIAAGEVGLLWVINEPANLVRQKIKNSPLEDTFLFKTLTAPDQTSRQEWDPVLPTQTKLTQTHPVTRWANEQKVFSVAPWQNLGPTRVWGYFRNPRPTTKVLLSAGNRPLLSIGKVGQGKVALLATGESWRWLTPQPHAPARRHTPALAKALWTHLCQWLSGDGALQSNAVRLLLAKNKWEWQYPLSAGISIQQATWDSDLTVEMSLTKLSNFNDALPAPQWFPFGTDAGSMQLANSGKPLTSASPNGAIHIFNGQTKPIDSVGEWLVRVRVTRKNGSVIGYDRARITVTGSSLEEKSIMPNQATLEAAVKAAGPQGRIVKPTPKDISSLVSTLDKRLQPKTVTRKRMVSAINQGALLFLLLLALSVDAWLRRS